MGIPSGSVVKNLPANAADASSIPGLGRSPGGRNDSSILAWKIPRTEKPGRLQSMGSQRVRHNWASGLACILLTQGVSSYCSTLEPLFLQIFPWLPHFLQISAQMSGLQKDLSWLLSLKKAHQLYLVFSWLIFSSQLLYLMSFYTVICCLFLFVPSEFKVLASPWKNSETSKEVKKVKWGFI